MPIPVGTMSAIELKSSVEVLTFDLYGTIVDMQKGLTDIATPYLKDKGWRGNPNSFVTWWRRTHFENSMIDALIDRGHTPYREIGRRAVTLTLERAGIDHTQDEVKWLVSEIEKLKPFPDAREALTDYAVETRFHGIAQVRAFPKTGRTHQIRVHLAFAGYPILADRLYSGRAAITRGDLSGDRDDATVVLNRQALHAQRLTFEHPLEGREVTFESPLPEDLAETLRLLKQFRGV